MAIRSIGLILWLLLLVGSRAQAAPCAGFVDVDDTSGPTAAFCADVTWIKNRGVTLGCTATEYCPFLDVTRIQMAAFMHRLGEALFPSTCAGGQVMKWNGSAWTCANDNAGGAGTVTSIAAGTGLQGSPNPITGAGSLNLASSYQLPQGCGNGHVAKSNGSGGWTCAADTGGSGTVTSVGTGTGLTGGPITTTGTIAVNTALIQSRVTGSCGAGSSIRTINADGSVVCEVDDNSAANAFVQGGNAFGATAVLGSNDSQPLELRAGGLRVMRYEPSTISPNVVGGSSFNSTAGVRGATIGGGGTRPEFFNPDPDITGEGPNVVFDAYGTIGGGLANVAGSEDPAPSGSFAVIAGGRGNRSGTYSTTSGRENVASQLFTTVAGGEGNQADNVHDSIGGGQGNTATISVESVVLGGVDNVAYVGSDRGSIAGGHANRVEGPGGSILGGAGNYAAEPIEGADAIAAGTNARATRGLCVVFSLWPGSAPGLRCEATSVGDPLATQFHRFRIAATNGFSVDYHTQRPDGGGERWAYIGGLFAGNTISTWTGGRLTDGGVWANASDRTAKENIEAVDVDSILEGVAGLPLARWFYRAESSRIAHMGPAAQDFRAAFGLGSNDTTIATVDASGVALAAIQGLYARVRTGEEELARLHRTADAILSTLQ